MLVVSFVSGGMDPAWTSDGCDMVCSWPNKGSLVIERLPVIKRRFARDHTKFARDQTKVRTLENDRAKFCSVFACVEKNATLARHQAVVLLVVVRSIFPFFSAVRHPPVLLALAA